MPDTLRSPEAATQAGEQGRPGPGPVALVTGAGTGIGRAVALAFFGAGYRVVLAGRRPGPLDELAAQLRAAEPGRAAGVLPHSCDICDPAAVARLFAAATGTFGRLDVLFNNAGVSAPAVPLEEISLAQWSAVIDTNLTGAFLCTQQALRIMKHQQPRGGRIINNGSISAQTPRPFSGPYTASKHALTGLTKSTALDGRDHDIACGQIDIGNADTSMTLPMAEGALQPDGSRRVEARMDVAHVGEAVLHMASLPLDANILFMTIMARRMPFVGRG